MRVLESPQVGCVSESALTQFGALTPPFGAMRLKIVELVMAVVRSEVEDPRLVLEGEVLAAAEAEATAAAAAAAAAAANGGAAGDAEDGKEDEGASEEGDCGTVSGTVMTFSSVGAALVEHGVMGRLLECFFTYHWQSSLHAMVESLVHTILDSEEASSPEEGEEESETDTWTGRLVSVTVLRRDLFGAAGVLGRLEAAYEANTVATTPKTPAARNGRLGYMGHLIRICAVLNEAWPALKPRLEKLAWVPAEAMAKWEAFLFRDIAKELVCIIYLFYFLSIFYFFFIN